MKREQINIELPISATTFLTYCKTELGLSEGCTKGYENDLKIFFDYIIKAKGKKKINNNFIKGINRADLSDFLLYCEKERKNGECARGRKVSTLKAYFNYLEDIAEIIIKNPTRTLKTPKVPKREPVYLTLNETKQVLSSLGENSRTYTRDYCIFVILLNTGIRISELLGIKLTDIRENELTVIGKGNKQRTIPLNNACVKAINNYLNERNNENLTDEEKIYLINIKKDAVENMVKKNVIQSGIVNGEKYTPHKMRHTASTLMYKYGKTDIVTLQEILGHSNLSTTQIYTHCDKEDVQQAVNNNPLADL
jgi:site-specific recombinase XerD